MNVAIRPLIEQDAYTSYKWRNNPDVFKYTGNIYTKEITLESVLAWIRRVIENKNEYRCAILVDEIYVGNIYLTNIIVGYSAEYHIFIGDKSYWGKGVAQQASIGILHYGFSNLNVQTIYLEVHVENIVAVCLYEKLGFVTKEIRNDFIVMEIHKDNYNNIILKNTGK